MKTPLEQIEAIYDTIYDEGEACAECSFSHKSFTPAPYGERPHDGFYERECTASAVQCPAVCEFIFAMTEKLECE